MDAALRTPTASGTPAVTVATVPTSAEAGI
jgi:hypothetical protein